MSDAGAATVAVAKACVAACPGFVAIASDGLGTSHVGLGAVCDPDCRAGRDVATGPAATYWHRFAEACHGARYGATGHKNLLTIDSFVRARARSYLRGLASRARGKTRAQIEAAIAPRVSPRFSLPATVDGLYAAPHSRLGVEASQAWLMIAGQPGGLVSAAGWPRAASPRSKSQSTRPQWKPSAPVDPQLGGADHRTGNVVVLAASSRAALSGVGVALRSLTESQTAYVGVALPRGVLGVHPVALAPRRDGPLTGIIVIVMRGDAMYLASKKVPRSASGHDWATVRTLVRAVVPPAGTTTPVAVQLGPGATIADLVRLLDLAHGLGASSVAIVPAAESVATGVTEISADRVLAIVGRPTVGGGLHVAQVVAALRLLRPALRRCYADELAGKPKLSGTAVARLGIEASGKPAGVGVRGVDQAVSACAARVLRNATFPAPRSGGATVRFPISFSRKPG